MTNVSVSLPNTLARQARERGLLKPGNLARLLRRELLCRQAGTELLAVAGRVAAAGIAPMTESEIQAEVEVVRGGRKHACAGRARH